MITEQFQLNTTIKMNIKNINPIKINNLKINLHIIDACNYSCKHCFAKFGSTSILGFEKWKSIIDNCIENSNVSEFNIAGGEPMLHPQLMDIVKYIVSKGKRCSLITNGILMNESWIKENAKYFCMIGFSVDSFNKEIMDNLGRTTKQGDKVTLEKFTLFTEVIKEYNKDCVIKVNTVVSSLNFNDNIAKDIKNLQVDKWKVLKMRIFSNGKFDNSDIAISNEEFDEFCAINLGRSSNKSNISEKIKLNNTNVVIEKDVVGGYIFIDSNGDLLDNTNSDSHKSVGSCISKKFNTLFNKINLDEDLYQSRY